GTSISGLTRGLLALIGSKAKDGSREFKVKVVRGITKDERRTPEVRVLRRILAKTLEDRRPVFEGDARKSDYAKGEQDVDLYALGAVTCLPLEAEGELWGAILLDEPQRRRDFTKTEIELLSSFARHAAVTLARLSDRTKLAQRSERLRTEREVLRETLEETQHELKVLRRESGRLQAQSSRFAAITQNDGKLEEFLGRSFSVAKKAFLRHYLKQAIDRSQGDLERASNLTGLNVAKLVKLLEIYDVKPGRSSLLRASSSSEDHN
ncbi:MAG: GAF domain-containing protein, partial [Planctomycetota bacterium]